MKRIGKLLLMLILMGCSPGSETSNPVDNTTVERASKNQNSLASVERLLQTYHEQNELNGNVLIAKAGKAIYEASFGYADPAKSIKLNRSHRFNIGSIYKEFPAVAILQLMERGQLGLDDKVSDHLSGLGDWAQEVSILNLVQYTSGLPQVAWDRHPNTSDDDLIEDLQVLQVLEFEPGSRYLYTNNSPFLLKKIVEEITGLGFYDYATENLFAPLEMSVLLQSQYPYLDKSFMALPFDANFQEDVDFWQTSDIYCLTAEDLHKWFAGLHSLKLIDRRSLDILAQQPDLDIKYMQSSLGYAEMANGDLVKHYHQGSSNNYNSIAYTELALDTTVIILTNSKRQNIAQMSEQIMQLLNEN